MSKHHQHHASAAQQAAEQDLEKQHMEQPTADVPQEASSGEAKPDYYEQFVRLSADFENFRKRTEREKAAFLSYGKKELAEKLLPAYEILLKQAAELGKNKTEKEDLKNIVSGIQMILDEMEKAFRSEGVIRMDVLNKPYDPATQEVVAMVPANKEQDGLVLQEVQMGFMLDGKVLRPARVMVGQCAEE